MVRLGTSLSKDVCSSSGSSHQTSGRGLKLILQVLKTSTTGVSDDGPLVSSCWVFVDGNLEVGVLVKSDLLRSTKEIEIDCNGLLRVRDESSKVGSDEGKSSEEFHL